MTETVSRLSPTEVAAVLAGCPHVPDKPTVSVDVKQHSATGPSVERWCSEHSGVCKRAQLPGTSQFQMKTPF